MNAIHLILDILYALIHIKILILKNIYNHLLLKYFRHYL